MFAGKLITMLVYKGMLVYLWIYVCVLMHSCLCPYKLMHMYLWNHLCAHYELMHVYLWTDACVLMNWCVYTYELMHVYLWTSACVLMYFCMCTYALYAIYNASSKFIISILVLASTAVLQGSQLSDFHLSPCHCHSDLLVCECMVSIHLCLDISQFLLRSTLKLLTLHMSFSLSLLHTLPYCCSFLFLINTNTTSTLARSQISTFIPCSSRLIL